MITAHRNRVLLAAAALALALLGCAERPRSGAIALRLAARAAPGGTPRLVATGDGAVVTLGRDSLVLRRVELVLKDVQLAPVASGECEPEEEEHCAPLDTGPVLVELPLGDDTRHRATVAAPAGTYIVFHFAIHRPDPSHDGAFLAAHPDFAGTSIRVSGSFSRAGARRDFVYTSGFSEREESSLLPPLTLQPGDTANLTLRLGLAGWFVTADKAALIDPATAERGQPNESLVLDNIRTSVAAFRDDDHDGLDDHSETSPQTAAPSPHAPAVSPWPADPESAQLAALVARQPASVPRCRDQSARITPDSIGPFRLEQSLTDLQRDCPQLLYGWELDPDGFPVPAVAARLGGAVVTALLTDTLPGATVRQVDVAHVGPRTAAGLGVGSTLRQLEGAYGPPRAAEPGCVLRVWFAALPGVAFRMEFPPRLRRECGGLSEEPLPPNLRVAAVILVPR